MAAYVDRGIWHTLGRLLFGVLLVLSLLIFILWRTDNARLQALRMSIVDRITPTLNAIAGPSNALGTLVRDFESYAELQEENDRLRRRLERMTAWREVAQRLEEENARLRALNNVKVPPRFGFATAEVIADSGGPFSQSVLVNLGSGDGVDDGAAAVDASGVVGRVVGVGEQSARVLLLTDLNSRAPVLVGEGRERAILSGDNTDYPQLDFVFAPERIVEGARVLTSGEGGVFPPGLQIGRVALPPAQTPNAPMRVVLSADLNRLDFVRLFRRSSRSLNPPEGGLILRPQAAQAPSDAPDDPAEAQAGSSPSQGSTASEPASGPAAQ
ncbi:MAG: rod shape-determining protein MreC [Neomegalonema sp.]|nr:rod shape-determining protein MreC [Neomegalonema sp.]